MRAAQVRLFSPCAITELHIEDLRPAAAPGASPVARSSMQAYARDLTCSQAARYAPLLPSTLSCAAGAAASMATRAVLTDHVVVRGRYSKLTMTVMGVPEHDGDAAADRRAAATRPRRPDQRGGDTQQQQQGAPAASDSAAWVMPALPSHAHLVQPTRAVGSSADAPGKPPRGLQLDGVVQLPLAQLPTACRQALTLALDYFTKVGPQPRGQGARGGVAAPSGAAHTRPRVQGGVCRGRRCTGPAGTLTATRRATAWCRS